MLDDVLSAVDAQVAQWILTNGIMGHLMVGRTHILCTHNVQVSPYNFMCVLDITSSLCSSTLLLRTISYKFMRNLF